MKDDVIYRQLAIDAVEYWHGVDASEALEKLPSAQPERKKGKWIDNKGLYQCSVCKHIWSELWWVSTCPIDRMNEIMQYCPNCGCRMEGKNND